MLRYTTFSKRLFSKSALCLANNGKPQNPPIDKTIEIKRARLTYQSRKRGILESDLLLSRFAKKYLNKMTQEELDEYDKLLDEADWDIYYWATKNFEVTPLPDKWKDSKILKLLQEEAENKERVILRMPELDEGDFLKPKN